MHAIVHAADVQDRDGGVLLMATLFGLYPFLLKLYADGGYQGAQFQAGLAATLKRVNVEIVKRSDQAPSASSSCPNDGLSSEPSPGSHDAEGSQRIGSASIARRLPSSSSLPSAS
jgi:hypothetical protein